MKNVKNKIYCALFGIIFALAVFSCVEPEPDTPEETDGEITIGVRILSLVVLRGGNAQCMATVTGTTNKDVTWSIDDENKHQDTEIKVNPANRQVMLYVAEDETLTTITIRASSKEDPNRSGAATVPVPVPEINGVEISLLEPWVVPWQNVVDVGPGGEIEFTAKAVGKDFSRDAITWLIDDNGKNTSTTITGTTFTDDGKVISQGQLKVASGEVLQSFKVQAFSKWDESKIGEVTVNVKEPTLKGAELTGPWGIAAGSSGKYKAIITGTGKVDQEVDWEILRMSYSIFRADHKDPLSPEEVAKYGLDPDYEYGTGNWGGDELNVRLGATGITVTKGGELTWAITWRNTGIKYDHGYIFEAVPIQYDPDTRAVTYNVCDELGGPTGEDLNTDYNWKTLDPFVSGTAMGGDGTFSVDGQEVYGAVIVSATPRADPSLKKEMEIEISYTGVMEPPTPSPVSLKLKQ
ncbi:MAG: hypothetical protein LBG91_01300 [Treponema sp.]|jgi:hypothetical protein|nr:hypothetical protein [Treponema sp.]